MNEVIESAVARWTDPERRPLFKGSLVDTSGGMDGEPGTPDGPCMCAQGDILFHELGWSIDQLRNTAQESADREVAKALGISVAHAILLRNVNDQADGAPQTVLTEPQKILGDQAHIVLAFWWHMDQMTAEQWVAAWVAARAAARAAAGDAARVAARVAASYACAEIQGARILREQGKPFYFLPMFGFADPEAVLAAYPLFALAA